MTEQRRKAAALRLRALLNKGTPRKMAILQVRQEIRKIHPKLPCSRTQLYAWCKRFKVSTR